MDETKQEEIKEEAKTEETKEPDSQKNEKNDKKAEKENRKSEKKIAELEEKLKASEDKYLRMMAEYDNFRKRTAKEKEGIYADAYGDCIGNILPILDNLSKAKESDNLEGVRKGLELTEKAFADALNKMGITEIETKTFNPEFHNAVMHIEDEQYGPGEIVDVFQKGYKKGDKVIRYAMVRVAN